MAAGAYDSHEVLEVGRLDKGNERPAALLYVSLKFKFKVGTRKKKRMWGLRFELRVPCHSGLQDIYSVDEKVLS